MSGSEFQVLTVVFWKKILYTKDGSPEGGAALPEAAVRIAVAQTAAGMCNDWRLMERPRIAAVLFWALSTGKRDCPDRTERTGTGYGICGEKEMDVFRSSFYLYEIYGQRGYDYGGGGVL